MPPPILAPTPCAGSVYRASSIQYFSRALSTRGSREKTGRFNRKGLSALYCSFDAITAMAEYHRAGDARPCVVVAINLVAHNLIDLSCDPALLDHDWAQWEADWETARDALDTDPLSDCPSWRCGDAVLNANCSGLVFPSRFNPTGRNVCLFVDDAITGSLQWSPVDPNLEIMAANPVSL